MLLWDRTEWSKFIPSQNKFPATPLAGTMAEHRTRNRQVSNTCLRSSHCCLITIWASCSPQRASYQAVSFGSKRCLNWFEFDKIMDQNGNIPWRYVPKLSASVWAESEWLQRWFAAGRLDSLSILQYSRPSTFINIYAITAAFIDYTGVPLTSHATSTRALNTKRDTERRLNV